MQSSLWPFYQCGIKFTPCLRSINGGSNQQNSLGWSLFGWRTDLVNKMKHATERGGGPAGLLYRFVNNSDLSTAGTSPKRPFTKTSGWGFLCQLSKPSGMWRGTRQNGGVSLADAASPSHVSLECYVVGLPGWQKRSNLLRNSWPEIQTRDFAEGIPAAGSCRGTRERNGLEGSSYLPGTPAVEMTLLASLIFSWWL